MLTIALAAGAGFIAGAFTPAVGRKIKSYFVKETKAASAAVQTDVSAAAKKL